MKKLSDYYCDTDIELLELIKYHEDFIDELKKKGMEHADHKETLVVLGNFKGLVDNAAKRRVDMEESKVKENLDFMDSRLHVECPECKTVNTVEIIGEEKNEGLGVLC